MRLTARLVQPAAERTGLHHRYSAAGEGRPRSHRSIHAAAYLGVLAAVIFGAEAPQAGAQTAIGKPAAIAPMADAEVDAAIAEASIRFGLPPAWIEAVMVVESGRRRRAISPKGAMGLLQLMPQTWRDLSGELGLGDDPFEPRANILAGAAYLRRLYDRFGAPGFLGAYNAGPERYAGYLAGVRGLPAETRAYIERLAPLITHGGRSATPTPADWRTSDLFVAPGGDLLRGEAGR